MCTSILLVTYYPDRPDVMATFKHVRIEGDKKKFPVLLSNGNLLEEGDCEDGRHYAIWYGESCSYVSAETCAMIEYFKPQNTKYPSFIV